MQKSVYVSSPYVNKNVNPKTSLMEKQKRMKKVVDIDVEENPHLHNMHLILSAAINQAVTKEEILYLSQDRVLQRIADGELRFKGMDQSMKLPQSRFYHYYDEKLAETIVQIHDKKLAVFSEDTSSKEK